MDRDEAIHGAIDAYLSEQAKDDDEAIAAFLASLRANGWVVVPVEATLENIRALGSEAPTKLAKE